MEGTAASNVTAVSFEYILRMILRINRIRLRQPTDRPVNMNGTQRLARFLLESNAVPSIPCHMLRLSPIETYPISYSMVSSMVGLRTEKGKVF